MIAGRRQRHDEEVWRLNQLKQAAYNLSRFIREHTAPHDAGTQSQDWPLQLIVSEDETAAHRLATFLEDQEQKLANLGYPVTP